MDTIELAQVPLGLVPKVLDSIDVILFLSKEFWVIDSHVVEVAYIERIVGFKGVCINDAVRSDFLFDDRLESFGFSIGNDRPVYLPAPLQ